MAGAYHSTRLVGASVGFLSAPPSLALHSHVTGAGQGRGIGFALEHQRDRALARGLDRITWTFTLWSAATPPSTSPSSVRRYHSGFYGTMRDGINGSDDSDRVLARWDLHLAFSVGHLLGTAPRSPTRRSPGRPAVRLIRGEASPTTTRTRGARPRNASSGIASPV